jgi:hypothetical protein
MGSRARYHACLQMLALVSTLTVRAHADEARAQCATAYEGGQEARRDGKFQLAAERLVSCSQPKCGEAISRECRQLYSSLQEAMPSVVFGARDEEDQDLVDVSISIDGKLVQKSIDGHAVTLDPGVHTFRFSSRALPAVDKVVAIREGEKFRLLSVTLGAATVPSSTAPHAADLGDTAAAGTVTAPAAADSSAKSAHGIPVASYVLGGVGVVGFAAFGYFRLSGFNDFNSLKDSCKTHCTEDDVASVRDKFTISSVSAVVGGAALGGALAVWLLNRSSSNQPAAAAVAVLPLMGGGSAVWRGSF